VSHYKPHIIRNTKQKIKAAASTLDFIVLVPDAASGVSADDEEDVDEASPDTGDEVRVEELEESVKDDESIDEVPTISWARPQISSPQRASHHLQSR
jgi:hypothetical protein